MFPIEISSLRHRPFSSESFKNISCQKNLPKGEPESPQTSLVLRFIGTCASVTHHPRFIAPIERTPSCRIAAAISHDTTNYNTSDLLLLENRCESSVNEGII